MQIFSTLFAQIKYTIVFKTRSKLVFQKKIGNGSYASPPSSHSCEGLYRLIWFTSLRHNCMNSLYEVSPKNANYLFSCFACLSSNHKFRWFFFYFIAWAFYLWLMGGGTKRFSEGRSSRLPIGHLTIQTLFFHNIITIVIIHYYRALLLLYCDFLIRHGNGHVSYRVFFP